MAISLNNHESRIRSLEAYKENALKIRKITGNKLPTDFISGLVEIHASKGLTYSTCVYFIQKGISFKYHFGVTNEEYLIVTYDGNNTLNTDVGVTYINILTI